MFFNDWMQRKLAALLHPWLRQEPELELKLGFIRSQGIAKYLIFDTSALNQLLDDSARFLFTDFRIDELSLRVSNWSAPAFTIVVDGLHVTLSEGEVKERGVNQRVQATDTSMEDMKKVLSKIDPEGSALHDAMERISNIICLSNWKSSTLNTILAHCHLQIRHIHLLVQCPSSNNSFSCLLEIGELDIESRYRNHGCLLGGVVSSLVLPSRENYFAFEVRGFTIGLKSKDHISNVFSSTYLQPSIVLKDLQLINFNFSVPELEFTFSTSDIFGITTLNEVPAKESKCAKTGKQLWRIAASRISSLVPARRWSFQKLVNVVCLWMRYVHAYEHLLSSVGYPVDNMIKRSAIMMYRDKIFSRSIKQQWKTISEIEKELPVEAAVLARRLVRCRAAVTVNQCKDSSVELPVSSRSSLFQKLLQLLAVVWSSIGSMFYSIIQFLLLQFFFADHPRNYVHWIVSDDTCPQRCFSVNIGRISITISPEKAVHPPIVGRSASDIGFSYSDLLSFCVSVDAFFFVYKENVYEQFLSFSCGNLKVMSSSVVRDNSNNYGSYIKGRNKKLHDSVPILWGQPAQFIDFAETTATGSTDDIKSASVLFLGRLVQEMWLTWKNCAEFDDSKLSLSEHPFILCELKSFLTDQGLNSTSSGSWNCCLVVGKLNLILGYSSILSLSLIVKQIQRALRWRDSSWKVNAPVHTPVTCEDTPMRDWDSKYNSYASGVEIELYKMLPAKLFQIGVFIAGPHIQISLRKEGFYGKEVNVNNRQNDLHLVFDIHNFELAIKPTLISDLASTFGGPSMHDEAPNCPRLKEPEITYIPISANKNYGCLARSSLSGYLKIDGLNAYLDDSTENQRHQIIVLNPTTFHLSSIRKELYSLGATVVAFSAAVRGITSGLVVLLFIDEFTVLAEVVVGLTSVLSNALVMFDSVGSVNFEDSVGQEMVQAHSESMGKLMTGGKMGDLVLSSIQLVINCAYELKSMDIVLNNSRKSNSKDFMKVAVGNKELAMHEMPNFGVCISIKQSCIKFSCKERKVEVLANFSGLRAVIFKFVSEILKSSDQFYFSSLLLPSLNCIQELSISDCTFTLWLRSLNSDSSCGGMHSDSKISHMVEESPLTTDTEGSRTHSSGLSQKFNVARQSIGPASSHWVLANIGLSEIYLAGSQIKDILVGAHKMNKLESSLSIGEDFQKISCQTQGGFIFLEAEAMVMFFQCFSSYQRFIRHLLPVARPPVENLRAAVGENMTAGDDHPRQERHTIRQNVNWEKLDQLTIGLSEFSLVLLARDESGTLQEFLLEADIYLNIEIADRKKFLFRLSHLSILSHILRESVEQQSSEIQISQFSSVMSSNLSSPGIAGDPTIAFQHMDGIHSAVDDAISSSPSISTTESYMDKTGSQVSYSNPQNYILKQLGASFALEKPLPRDDISHLLFNQHWFGGGSISGFDMTISLREIQLILSAIESLSGVFNKETTNSVGQRYWSRNQEAERSFEEIVPDGTVVALQDIHQHMYITVEGAQNNYSLVGAIHYSVVGERALFRVKYHYQRRWKSQVLWVSLTSLHAKNSSGEPLRLNYRPGSGFVDISSSSDSGWALWKILPFKPVSYDGDTEVESYSPAAKNTFHLVNRKNDCAIAFADDTLEFVNKPGNPFKWKVFQDFYLARDTILLNSISMGASRTSLRQTSDLNDEGTSERTGSPTGIIVEVDKLTLTIVHEISDTKDKIPLLQVSIIIPELIVQILNSKARILSRLDVVLYYFDAQRNLWRELLHPAELSIFHRSRFQNQGSEMVLPAVPVHFYARIKELDISMTELSLDILLFVIGKLNIAGPFAVRSSVIFANCCKVENQSGVTLRCHFHENQDASVARKQTSMIFLRHLALVNQPSDASLVTIQLTERGSFSTSPIHISLLEDRTFAWRTRIVSSQDSKTYPGPFIVAEISRKREDGLSFVVSPLLRIHNETDFSMELRFQRPQHKEAEFASVILKTGDTIDDSLAAFGAINLSGGLKKALVSLSVGNFLFSFRPEITDDLRHFRKLRSAEWSDDLKGGKAILLSGLFDKLGYQVRKALSESVKCSFSTAHCSLKSEEGHVDDIHFLIQSIGKDIPVIQPDSTGYARGNRNSSVALQEQREIFILPTIQISNLLQSEIKVVLTDKDPYNTISCDNIGKQAIIPCGSTANLYANPATIYFTVTLTAFSSSCKPVNSADWVKKLQKQKHDINSLDIELDFGSGKYFAFLRLSFKDNGILEAAIFTSYTLKNDTDFLLFCSGPNQKPVSRDEAGRLGSEIPTELGSFLPAKSTTSWFMKYNKVRIILLEGKAADALLDLDALSGLTEIELEGEEGSSFKYITKLGVSLRPSMGKVVVPSRIVSINPRYVVSNESEEVINVRQCYLEDDIQGVVAVNSKQKTVIQLRNGTSKKREISIFENFLRNHRNARDDSLLYVQFQPKEGGFDWSGPICVASLGRFFLKFKRSKKFPVHESSHVATLDKNVQEFSSINVIEEDSTLVLHFNRPPNTSLPYRIENCLEDASITYYQKGSSEPEILEAKGTINYVWDDLSLPHKLVIQINDVHLLREINLDKVRAWKPFYRIGKQRGLGFQLPLERKPGHKKSSFGQLNGIEIVTPGYEIYADGPTRVLRICEFSDSRKADTAFSSGAKMKLRVSNFAIRILEHSKKVARSSRCLGWVSGNSLTRLLELLESKNDQAFKKGRDILHRLLDMVISTSLDKILLKRNLSIKFGSDPFSRKRTERSERDTSELPIYTPIIVIRLWNIDMDSLFTNQRNFNRIRVQSLNVDQKWEGAPFASMIRRHQSEYPDRNDSMLRVVIILLSSSSEVKQVEYSSIVLQPLDLNLDEETLMRIVPFWRTSLSDPNTPSQQYYFDHFEIHPIKIIASFLPGEFYSSYSSTQETLRSLLHSVIKIPAIKNKTVELNGVLVTHALITIRELSIKCAQHYSWYAMRAIYIAKGSPLLPPAFASIFDDSASSSLDVFFDPSSGLINLPGLTIGTFKLISKCIDGKGFSGTKRYFGDLGKTLKTAGSNILFAAVTEISDSVLKGAETSGFNGMVSGFHQGILKLAMEPAVLGSAFLEGGPDRKIKLDRNPGVDELYIEGYLQAMLDAIYKQEYLRVRVVDDQVILKNLPPNSSLIEEIVDRVKGFLVSKALLKGDSSTSHHLHHLRGESDWKIGPTVLTLCEHLFVSFMIRGLRKQAGMLMARVKWKEKLETNDGKAIVPVSTGKEQKKKIVWKFGIGKFVLSGVVAYLDGRLCRSIPNPIARRIVSGFLLTFLDTNDQ